MTPTGSVARSSYVGFLAVAVSAAVALLGATGCGNLALSADFASLNGPSAGLSDGGAFADVSAVGLGSPDAGPAQAARASQGSPLCGIPAGGAVCDPDPPNDAGQYVACAPVLPLATDSGTSVPPPADASSSDDAAAYDDAAPAEDAGSPEDAGTATDAGSGVDSAAPTPTSEALACRVVNPPGSDAGFTPMCEVPGTGEDGAACKGGQDCAPTFECVGEAGKGVCRRYCCYNDCTLAGGATPGPGVPDAAYAPPQFCDIEPMAGYSDSHLVPVCVQKPSCALFQPCPAPANGAATTETCTIVDANGTTACIPPSSQGVGDSCEEEHCKAGLACWGIFPMRTCVQLCDATHSCPGGAMCQSNYSNFGSTDTNAGICAPM